MTKSPASLAASARAETLPWYKKPPLSKTHSFTPALRAFLASASPTTFAASTLPP